MTHRDPHVFLPADVSRCRPSHECTRKSTCARYLATIPPQGASMADFSLNVNPFNSCTMWISAATSRLGPSPGPGRRRVHPPLGSQP